MTTTAMVTKIMKNCRLLETDRNQITITCTWCIFLSKYYYYEYSCYSQVSKYTCLWSRDLYSLTRRTKTLLIDTTYTLLFPNSRIKTQLIVTNRILFQKNKKNSERLDRAITILQKQACYYSTYDIYIYTNALRINNRFSKLLSVIFYSNNISLFFYSEE